MEMPSHLIVGVVIGIAAHGKTVLRLFAMDEMFCTSTGRLWIIRTGFAGLFSSPFCMIQIPLRAVHEKSPLIGFTGYVYQSLDTSIPFLVSLMRSSLLDLPASMVRLWGAANGMGSDERPSGEPGLHALPEETLYGDRESVV